MPHKFRVQQAGIGGEKGHVPDRRIEIRLRWQKRPRLIGMLQSHGLIRVHRALQSHKQLARMRHLIAWVVWRGVGRIVAQDVENLLLLGIQATAIQAPLVVRRHLERISLFYARAFPDVIDAPCRDGRLLALAR